MARMLAMAEVSCAGIVDFVSFGMVKAAMIRIMVTTISSSIRVKPRSRFRLRIDGNLSQPPWPAKPCSAARISDFYREEHNRRPNLDTCSASPTRRLTWSLEGRFGFLLRRLFGFALWCVLISHAHSIAQN